MTDLERFRNCMDYKPIDRPPFWSWGGPWPETVERWKNEGYDPEVELPFKADRMGWHGGWFQPNPPFKHEVIEETEDTVLFINHEGILMRERKENRMSSMPQFVKFPVEDKNDFRKFWKERMQPDLSSRISEDWQEKLSAYKHRDFPLIIIADRWGGFFGPIRNLTGVENLCMLFYDDPVFLEEMMDADAELIIRIMDQVLDYTDIDVFGFWEDMAYKTAPLIGPDLVRKFMLPRYKRVIEHLKGRGVKLFALDSDGDISRLIPVWMDAGINVLYPFEVQCGMDVNEIRREYGKELRMWFGVDKRCMAEGRDAIDKELERVAPLIEDGGYIPGPDHSIPPDVAYSDYLYFMEQLEKTLKGI